MAFCPNCGAQIADKAHPDKRGLGRAWFGIVMGVLTMIAHTIGFCCAAS